LPKYQQYIEELKKENYFIVGYIRKSKQEIDVDNLIHLLQLMVDRLQQRSLVDKVFVSVNCNSNEPLVQRDINTNSMIKKLEHVDGDMQGNTIYS
jgi:hypothetical protein